METVAPRFLAFNIYAHVRPTIPDVDNNHLPWTALVQTGFPFVEGDGSGVSPSQALQHAFNYWLDAMLQSPL